MTERWYEQADAALVASSPIDLDETLGLVSGAALEVLAAAFPEAAVAVRLLRPGLGWRLYGASADDVATSEALPRLADTLSISAGVPGLHVFRPPVQQVVTVGGGGTGAFQLGVRGMRPEPFRAHEVTLVRNVSRLVAAAVAGAAR